MDGFQQRNDHHPDMNAVWEFILTVLVFWHNIDLKEYLAVRFGM